MKSIKSNSPVMGILLIIYLLSSLETFSQDKVNNHVISSSLINGNQIEYAAGDILVKIQNESKVAALLAEISPHDGKIEKGCDETSWVTVHFNDSTDIYAMINKFKKMDFVLDAHPNYIVHATDNNPSDAYYPFQWYLNNLDTYADIDAPQAWDITVGSSDVLMAILDTGIPELSENLIHCDLDDLSGKIYPGNNYTTEGGIYELKDYRGHGTLVAGIAGAETNNDGYTDGTQYCPGFESITIGTAGTSWGSKMLIEKVMNVNGQGTTEDVASAILHASSYAVGNTKVIINMSLAWTVDSVNRIEDVIKIAADRGVLVVVGSGNYGGNGDNTYIVRAAGTYASYRRPIYRTGGMVEWKNVIAVGATEYFDAKASYTKYLINSLGGKIIVSAPGGENIEWRDIFSTCTNYTTFLCPYGDDQQYWSQWLGRAGTSMAAPIVTGVAALIWSISPSLTPETIRFILETTADKVSGYSYTDGYAVEVGYGRINAYKALKYTLENYNCILTGTGSTRVRFTQSITTKSGTTLTIAPGTTVQFDNGKSLTINGTLIAEGTETNPITFTSSSATPTRGIWNQIRLNGTNNSIKYCDFRYPNYGLIVANTSSNIIDHCTFTDCSQSGIYALGTSWPTNPDSACLMTNCTFTNTYRGLLASNARATMKYCTIQNNLSPTGYGIYASNSTIFIDHSTIQNHYTAGAYITGPSAWIVFGTTDIQNGCNTLTQSAKQIYVTSNGRTHLGAGTSAPMMAYNNVYNTTGYLIQNMTSIPINARWCFWGTPISIYGPVDTLNKLGSQQCTGGAWTVPIVAREEGGDTGIGSSMENNITEFSGSQLSTSEIYMSEFTIDEWLEDISRDDPTSATALSQLAAARMELREQLHNRLNESWDSYLIGIEQSTTRSDLSELVRVHRIKALIDDRALADGQVLIDATLARKEISNELWFYCQGQKVYSNLLDGNEEDARKVLTSIEQTANNIDPQGYNDLLEMTETFESGTGLSSVNQSSGEFKQFTQPSSTPTAYVLEQNYPNPFNPLTTIHYAIPEDGYVTLRIYNMLGVLVSTLIDGYQGVGYKSVSFDGAQYPSGVYIYQLQAGTFSDMKKMVLIK